MTDSLHWLRLVTHILNLQYVSETDPPQAEEEYITVAGQAFEDQLQSIRPPNKLAPADLYHPASRDHPSTSSSDLSISNDEEGEAGPGVREMSETGMRAVLPAAPARSERPQPPQQEEEDRVAESVPTAGAWGPVVGTAIASVAAAGALVSAAPAVPPPEQEQASLQQTTEDRSRCQSTESTTLAPSEPIPEPSRPEPAHLATGTHGVDPVGDSSSSIAPVGAGSDPRRASYLHFPDPPPELEPPKPLAVERIPRSAPVLTEQYRYDPRERIVRPYRSHRCKHCAKVVLSAFPFPPLTCTFLSVVGSDRNVGG